MHRRLASPSARLPLAILALVATVSACTPRNRAPDEGDIKAEPAADETPPPAEQPPPALAASAGPVSLEVLPNFPLVYSGSLPSKLDLLIRLRGEEAGQAKRPPLDVAVILDRSGSMSGDKLLAVKQAALDLLKEIQPEDRISLVSYSDEVTVHTERLLADAAGVTTIRQQLLPIEATGGTALGPAMLHSLEILENAKRPEEVLAHVLLLSDGQANVGESDPKVLGLRASDGFGKGVSISTLGVGLDYNEDLMTKLADQGGGRYHFIEDSKAIPQVLADEMTGLVATIATGMTLEMRPSEGVKVDTIFGYPTTSEGSLSRARIGSLGAGQSRDIILRVDLPKASGDSISLGVLALDFADLTSKGERSHAELALTVKLSPDESAVLAAENTEVTVRVAEVESAAQLEAATRAVATGKYDDARLLLEKDIARLQMLKSKADTDELAAQVQGQIADLEEARGSVDKAETSQAESNHFQKSFKSKAYSKSKGSYATKKKGPRKPTKKSPL